jgi:dUTP pyrophosphatase
MSDYLETNEICKLNGCSNEVMQPNESRNTLNRFANQFEMEVLILDERAYQNVPILQRGTFGSAGLDILNCEELPIRLYPNEAKWFKTGLAIYIKDPNFVGLILPRSGKGGNLGLILSNTTGVLDSDYQGELKVGLWNRNETQVLTISPGEAIAQLVIVPLGKPKINVVKEFSKKTIRGENGFGSTGR